MTVIAIWEVLEIEFLTSGPAKEHVYRLVKDKHEYAEIRNIKEAALPLLKSQLE